MTHDLLVSNEAVDFRESLIAKLRELIVNEAVRITRSRQEQRITRKVVEEATEAVLKNFWMLVQEQMGSKR
jgi:phosphoribosyl-ATP pyrophosphohydrolase